MAEVSDRQTAKLKKLLNLTAYLTNKNKKGTSVRTVCEIFGLTRRQLMSSIDDIIMIGLPPYAPWNYINISIEGNRIRIDNSDWLQEPLSLTAEEAVSLKLMIRNVIRQAPGIFEAAGASLEAKVQAFLGHAPDETAPARRPGKKIELIKRALEESRVLEIEYYDPDRDEITVRKIEPHATVDWAGVPCVVAYCRFRKWRARFPIGHIARVRLLDERFEREEDFFERLSARWKSSPRWPGRLKVTVRFGPKRARWAKERFDDAHMTEQPDGSVVCVFYGGSYHWLAEVVADFEGEAKVQGAGARRRTFNRHLKSIENLYR